ncbi:hypothetical protein CSA80_00080 [Candidatus Saccharibacteria bacterium]|nr:MAG: hypothetical protein CSA80_00080 [Candidatus Saccharibacteria bacterium]
MAYKLSGHRTNTGGTKRNAWKTLLAVILVLGVLVTVAGWILWRGYQADLQPVGGNRTEVIVIEKGESVKNIAQKLKAAKLIRSERAFEYYARIHKLSSFLQAGSYKLSQAQGVPEIVSILTHGKVTTTLVTILPGQRLDQIRQSLIDQGFSESEVDAALEPAQYEAAPVLASKPAGAKLEGYLYPETFQRTATTNAKEIIEQSLAQMQQQLTPAITDGFKRQGLTVYEGITLASIVEQEVANVDERAQAAQVFIKRSQVGMPLGSDPTAFYASIPAGAGRDVTYDSPYNTRLYTGFPPTPIGNVSKSSLEAVANPADTDWLFFVSGDDGITRFSKTLQEHEALAEKYCHKLCGR